jgi:hypothetical protein
MWTVIFKSPKGWASDWRIASTRTSTPTLFPGARELAARVTDPFCIGASAKAALDFDHLPLNEGDTLSLGELSIGVLGCGG